GGRNGVIRLSSLNGSGVSGSVNVQYVADTTAISLVVVPEIACWQQQKLREQWDEADWPVDPFTATAVSDAVPVLLPIIDPHIVGVDDFRLPIPTGQATGAFDIWLARRRWIDQIQTTLAALGTNLDAMLDSLRPPAGAVNPTAYPWR